MSTKAAAAFDLPGSRDENWKYANLRPLGKARFEAATRAPNLAPHPLPDEISGYARYVFVDGWFAAQLSACGGKRGVTVEISRSSPGKSQNESADLRFAALNRALAVQTARIVAAADADDAACIELVFVATADAQNASSHPRVEVQADARARLALIERHVSLGAEANFINSAVNLDIGPAARVDHYRLQHAGARATWIDTLSATAEAGAAYRLFLVNLGAVSARSTMHCRLSGENAQLDLHAVSLGDRHQVQDAYALVEHAAARTRSRHNFRGIAAARSRVAFNSKVVVREGAHGADSHQSLRGLLAGAEAEIDVRPQLEIYTDDVRCAHGATAGKLDDAMLFYLLSRGIDPETARRLLKWAFLEDVVAKIEVQDLRRQIEQSLAGQMNETEAPQELP